MAQLLRLLPSIILAIVSLFLLFGEIDVQPVSFYILIFFTMRVIGLYCIITSWKLYLKWYKHYKQHYIHILVNRTNGICTKHTVISKPFLSKKECVEQYIERNFAPDTVSHYDII